MLGCFLQVFNVIQRICRILRPCFTLSSRFGLTSWQEGPFLGAVLPCSLYFSGPAILYAVTFTWEKVLIYHIAHNTIGTMGPDCSHFLLDLGTGVNQRPKVHLYSGPTSAVILSLPGQPY
jgi:hypothetical protein